MSGGVWFPVKYTLDFLYFYGTFYHGLMFCIDKVFVCDREMFSGNAYRVIFEYYARVRAHVLQIHILDSCRFVRYMFWEVSLEISICDSCHLLNLF